MRRSVRYESSLTSLLDVLFLLLFAALVQSAALVRAAENKEEIPAVAAAGENLGSQAAAEKLRQQAISQLVSELDAAITLVVYFDAAVADRIEVVDPAKRRSFYPQLALTQLSPDPDVALVYGSADDARLVCERVAEAAMLETMSGILVVLAPRQPVNRLPVALVEGLRSDQQACAERGTTVVIVEDHSGMQAKEPK